jgi:tetrahydromethanopterin S-methyltransferase subunit G
MPLQKKKENDIKYKRSIKLWRQIIIVCLLFFSIHIFSQNLIGYQVSKDISIRIPDNFSVIDTLQQTVVKAFIGEDMVMIIKPHQKDISGIGNEEDLLKFYDGVQEGVLEKTTGKLIDKKIVEIKGIKSLKISFDTTISGQSKIWDNYTVLLNNQPYSFTFIRSKENNPDFILQEDKIISSITFRKGLTIQNQFNNDEGNFAADKIGKLVGRLFIYIIVIGIILFLVLRKRKK